MVENNTKPNIPDYEWHYLPLTEQDVNSAIGHRKSSYDELQDRLNLNKRNAELLSSLHFKCPDTKNAQANDTRESFQYPPFILAMVTFIIGIVYLYVNYWS